MLHKIGTVKEMEKIKNNLPKEVYQAALQIVSALDEHYGEDRVIDEGDGGFVLILQDVKDIEEASDTYIQIDKDTYEYVSFVEREEIFGKCGSVPYINALSFVIMNLVLMCLCRKILHRKYCLTTWKVAMTENEK